MDNKRGLNVLPLLRAKTASKRGLCGIFWVSARCGAWVTQRVRAMRATEGRRRAVGMSLPYRR